MPEKQTNQERLKEITERIEAGIRDILESGDMQKYQEYLRTMSRFHRYSVNNQMPIHLQCPNATLVAGYNKWEKQFSRHVMQGEKGITIIAPTPYKKKIEQEKLDPDTKLPLLDENGDVILDEKEIKIPMFRPVKVFDYSQTDGKPLPEHVASPVAALTGDVENYAVFMEALRRSSPVPIQIKPLSSDLDGFFSPDTQSITLREGMSQVQTVCAAVHELAHARLHNYKKPEVLPDGVERGTAKSRSTEEVEAESISFMVCAYFGIETGGNSFGYVASWSKDATIPEFRASLDTIGKTANAIITDVETHFPVICKERGIELPHEKDAEQEAGAAATPQDQPVQPEVSRTVEEAAPEAVPEIAAPPDPGMSIAAMNAFGYTDADMLPLSKERALELLERDIPVYMLMEDNAEAMAFEPEDIEMHTGMFGITRQDWESVQDSVPPMDNAVIQERREQAFLNNPADSYAIFQLKSGEEQRLLRFVNTDYLQKHGLHPEKDNYELIYTGTLPEGGSCTEKLEGLYQQFNLHRPEDFYGHRLSVSDIIAIKERGVVSSHYLDSVGYTEIPGFWQPENYLKNAEMQLEDDYGMIDGIINNGPKQQEAVAPEPPKPKECRKEMPEKRPSVIARLRAPLPACEKTVRENAERDI